MGQTQNIQQHSLKESSNFFPIPFPPPPPNAKTAKKITFPQKIQIILHYVM